MASLPNFLSLTENYSYLSIPAQYLLAIVPHAAAIAIASRGRPLTGWDNSNPRTDALRATLQKRLPPASYERYQRCEAAHYNALEMFPAYAAAVVLGNVLRVDVGELNRFAVGMVGLRMLYSLVYIGVGGKGAITFLRSGVWFAMVRSIVRMMVTAGRKGI